jgi:thiamine-phosphate pyrophosphorylase
VTILELPVLCMVTDRRRCRGRGLEELVAAAVEGGAGMVQLREKDLPPIELYALARRLREITKGRALLFVNDRIDIALAAGADGVQLPEDGLPVAAVRRAGGAGLLVGRSVHGVGGAVRAESEGAALLVAGAVFETSSHAGTAPQGVEMLRQMAAQVNVPFLAIGGVTAGNLESVVRSGASGVAVISAITESADPSAATRELARELLRAWSAAPPGKRR